MSNNFDPSMEQMLVKGFEEGVDYDVSEWVERVEEEMEDTDPRVAYKAPDRLTKESAFTQARRIVANSDDYVDCFAQLKHMELTTKEALGILKKEGYVFTAVDGVKGGVGSAGAVLSTVRKPRYNYGHDDGWQNLHNNWHEADAEAKRLKEIRSNYEKRMRNIDRKLVDPDTGEMIQPAEQLEDSSYVTVSLES